VAVIGDRELLEFRRGYYEVLLGLLAREPETVVFERLLPGIEDRVRPAAALHPRLGEGWRLIADAAQGRSPDELARIAAEEFTALFLGPHDVLVQPYESYFLTGRFFERPLADVRQFLAEVGIEGEPDCSEPEDALAFELSIVARLIEAQAEAHDPDGEALWVTRQATFLKRHLLVWGPRCADDIAQAAPSALYRGVGALLGGVLQLERDVVREWGPPTIPTLEEARAALIGLGTWQGPLFDLSAGAPPRPRRGRRRGTGSAGAEPA
jgi:TorA maturation chaperone TorD